MGTVIASEKKLEKLPAAMFYFARAATYTGQGALTPEAQKTALTYVQKQYKNFHGSDEGFNDLLAAAKGQSQSAGWLLHQERQLRSPRPRRQRRRIQQESSIGSLVEEPEDGAHRSRRVQCISMMNMKGTKFPTLKGRVIKLEPAVKPKTILLAMEDNTNNTTTADATLKFEMPLAGKVDEGTELTFEGVADSYTASPFMVVFTVDKDKLHGWTGKNEPAPVRRKRPAAAN
jgi:hypothetical protein